MGVNAVENLVVFYPRGYILDTIDRLVLTPLFTGNCHNRLPRRGVSQNYLSSEVWYRQLPYFRLHGLHVANVSTTRKKP